MPSYRQYLSKDTDEMIKIEFKTALERNSDAFNVDINLIRAIIQQESQQTPYAIRYEKHLKRQKWYTDVINQTQYRDNKYAYCSMGEMQILYGTAVHMGFCGAPTELFQQSVNIAYGTKYLAKLLKRYGKIEDAISAYNQGNNRKDTNGQYKNQEYVDSVMGHYRDFAKGH